MCLAISRLFPKRSYIGLYLNWYSRVIVCWHLNRYSRPLLIINLINETVVILCFHLSELKMKRLFAYSVAGLYCSLKILRFG